MFTVNHYFEGRVSSLGYQSTEGKSTIGVMAEGEYEFGTSDHEKMTVIQGELIVQFPESTDWKSFKAGASFEVEANKKFKVKSVGNTSYLCQYS